MKIIIVSCGTMDIMVGIILRVVGNIYQGIFMRPSLRTRATVTHGYTLPVAVNVTVYSTAVEPVPFLQYVFPPCISNVGQSNFP